MVKRAKWTILTYIAAHNNLQALGERSFDQIIGVGSTEEVMHGILLDGMHGAARFVAGDSGLVLKQEHLHDFDSGDPDRLVETAQWLFRQYPAERYGLILWSHGTGWAPNEIEDVARHARGDTQVAGAESNMRARLPGSQVLFRTSLSELLKPDHPAERAILFDDGSGHALDTIQLARVAREIAHSIGQKLDFIGMDACLMASIEVAYQLRNSVAYMVASEELVPGHSWPYDLIFRQLHDQPDLPSRDVADLIVGEYVDYYRNRPPKVGGGDITKIALDLSKIDGLVAAMRDLAQALVSGMSEAITCLEQAQIDTYLRETVDEQRHLSKFNYHLWDIVSVCRHLDSHCDKPGVHATAAQVVRVFDQHRFVVRSGHVGEWFDEIGGLSVYWIPPKKQQPRHISRYYPLVDFARETRWHSMLESYSYADR